MFPLKNSFLSVVVQARALPPMRALVLVLKCYLKSLGLNEVATGGLSSYSLCNMVIAHLQEELKVCVRAGRVTLSPAFPFGFAYVRRSYLPA